MAFFKGGRRVSGLKVAVGTSNPVKLMAVRRVFTRYLDASVEAVRVDPGVPDQPVGIAQLLLGAANRAVRARSKAGSTYGVGIEAGPVILSGLPLETQVAVVVDRDDRAGLGFSSSFQLPTIVEDLVLSGRELGEVFPVKRPGDLGEGVGVIGVLTRGGVTRMELTMQAVEMALLPLVNPGVYRPLSISRLIETARVRDL